MILLISPAWSVQLPVTAAQRPGIFPSASAAGRRTVKKSPTAAHRLFGWTVKDNGQLVIVPDPAAGQAVGQGAIFYFCSMSLEQLRASIREQVGDAELG